MFNKVKGSNIKNINKTKKKYSSGLLSITQKQFCLLREISKNFRINQPVHYPKINTNQEELSQVNFTKKKTLISFPNELVEKYYLLSESTENKPLKNKKVDYFSPATNSIDNNLTTFQSLDTSNSTVITSIIDKIINNPHKMTTELMYLMEKPTLFKALLQKSTYSDLFNERLGKDLPFLYLKSTISFFKYIQLLYSNFKIYIHDKELQDMVVKALNFVTKNSSNMVTEDLLEVMYTLQIINDKIDNNDNQGLSKSFIKIFEQAKDNLLNESYVRIGKHIQEFKFNESVNDNDVKAILDENIENLDKVSKETKESISKEIKLKQQIKVNNIDRVMNENTIYKLIYIVAK